MQSVCKMWYIATDGVMWSVSVGHVREPCKKTAEPTEMPIGGQTPVGPRIHVFDWT